MTDNRGVRVDQSLRFAEQIVLLLADADSGQFARVPDWSLRCALAGAVLMDLAMENRIDTDPEQLFVIDSSPVGDDLLDPTLAEIAQASEARDSRYWVRHTADRLTASAPVYWNVSSSEAFSIAARGGSCGCSRRIATRPPIPPPTGT